MIQYSAKSLIHELGGRRLARIIVASAKLEYAHL